MFLVMVGNKHKELALCANVEGVDLILDALLERKPISEYTWSVYDLDKALIDHSHPFSKLYCVFPC